MANSHTIAQAKYDAVNCTGFYLKLNNKTDSDIIAKLSEQESKQGYIKQLIREDIARIKAASAPKTEGTE